MNLSLNPRSFVLVIALFFLLAALGCDGDNGSKPDVESSSSSADTVDVSSSSEDGQQKPLSSSSRPTTLSSSSGTVSSSSAETGRSSSSEKATSSSSAGSSSSRVSSSSAARSSSSSECTEPWCESLCDQAQERCSTWECITEWPPLCVNRNSVIPITKQHLIWGTLTDDRDGKEYATINLSVTSGFKSKYGIDSLRWMAQNLDYGTPVTTLNLTDDGKVEKFCYNDSLINCERFGGLYQWHEAVGVPYATVEELNASEGWDAYIASFDTTTHRRGICPEGWHIPGREEMNAVVNVAPNSFYGLYVFPFFFVRPDRSEFRPGGGGGGGLMAMV